MSFVPYTKLLLRFTDTSLLDEVSGQEFLIEGEDTDLELLPQNEGYQLKQNQYLYANSLPLGILGAFSIGFWMKSCNAGKSLDTVTGTSGVMSMPFLSIGNDELSVIEETTGNNTNRLRFMMRVGSYEYDAYTGDYDSSQWHYVWITYTLVSNAFEIHMDGVELTLTETGNKPNGFLLSTAAVKIGAPNSYLTDSSATLRHFGAIDDLVILDSTITSVETLQKIINLSIDYVVDSSYSSLNQVEFPILFDDPTAVKVTDVDNDGVYIFATRSDGKILQGSPLLWDSRKDYGSSFEEGSIKKFGDGVSISDGFLKITNGVVRI